MQQSHSKPEARPLVLSIHGIRTTGQWQDELAESLDDAGFRHRPMNFGFFRAASLLLPWARQGKVDWFLKEIEKKMDADGTPPSIIAHSFGTYILTKALEKQSLLRFDRIILCGSIVRCGYPWSTIVEGKQVNYVLNEAGGKDFWCGLVGWVVSDAGPSGVEGFDEDADGRILQLRHALHRHSDYFSELNYRKRWIPFLKGIAPEKPPKRPRSGLNIRFLVFITALISTSLFGAFALIDAINSRNQKPIDKPSNTAKILAADVAKASSADNNSSNVVSDFQSGSAPATNKTAMDATAKQTADETKQLNVDSTRETSVSSELPARITDSMEDSNSESASAPKIKPNRSSVAYAAKALGVGEPGTHVDDLSTHGISATVGLYNGLQVARYKVPTLDGQWNVVQFLDAEQNLRAVSLQQVFDSHVRKYLSNDATNATEQRCSQSAFEQRVASLVSKLGQPKIVIPLERKSTSSEYSSTRESTYITTQSRQWPLDQGALLVLVAHHKGTDVFWKRYSGDELRSRYRTCTITICLFPDDGRDSCLAPSWSP